MRIEMIATIAMATDVITDMTTTDVTFVPPEPSVDAENISTSWRASQNLMKMLSEFMDFRDDLFAFGLGGGDVDTFIADLSDDPPIIEISGIGEFYVNGLSRIGWDIEVIEKDLGNGKTQKSMGNVKLPDITMTNLKVIEGGAKKLQEYIQNPNPGGEPLLRDATMILYAPDGG